VYQRLDQTGSDPNPWISRLRFHALVTF
jgi:hypothetical protein